MKFQDYEIKGRYFVAGYDLPQYLGWIDKQSGKWIVSREPLRDVLRAGKTFPITIGGVMDAGERHLFYSNPIKGKGGLTSATFFPLNDESISSVFSDKLRDPKSAYYSAPEPSIGDKIGSGFKKLLLLLAVVYLASVYIQSRK